MASDVHDAALIASADADSARTASRAAMTDDEAAATAAAFTPLDVDETSLIDTGDHNPAAPLTEESNTDSMDFDAPDDEPRTEDADNGDEEHSDDGSNDNGEDESRSSPPPVARVPVTPIIPLLDPSTPLSAPVFAPLLQRDQFYELLSFMRMFRQPLALPPFTPLDLAMALHSTPRLPHPLLFDLLWSLVYAAFPHTSLPLKRLKDAEEERIRTNTDTKKKNEFNWIDLLSRWSRTHSYGVFDTDPIELLGWDSMTVSDRCCLVWWLCESLLMNEEALLALRPLAEEESAEGLRQEPLGYDSEGDAYYHFGANDAYIFIEHRSNANSDELEEPQPKSRTRKRSSRVSQAASPDTDDALVLLVNLRPQFATPHRWSIACSSADEMAAVVESLRDSAPELAFVIEDSIHSVLLTRGERRRANEERKARFQNPMLIAPMKRSNRIQEAALRKIEEEQRAAERAAKEEEQRQQREQEEMERRRERRRLTLEADDDRSIKVELRLRELENEEARLLAERNAGSAKMGEESKGPETMSDETSNDADKTDEDESLLPFDQQVERQLLELEREIRHQTESEVVTRATRQETSRNNDDSESESDLHSRLRGEWSHYQHLARVIDRLRLKPIEVQELFAGDMSRVFVKGNRMVLRIDRNRIVMPPRPPTPPPSPPQSIVDEQPSLSPPQSPSNTVAASVTPRKSIPAKSRKSRKSREPKEKAKKRRRSVSSSSSSFDSDSSKRSSSSSSQSDSMTEAEKEKKKARLRKLRRRRERRDQEKLLEKQRAKAEKKANGHSTTSATSGKKRKKDNGDVAKGEKRRPKKPREATVTSATQPSQTLPQPAELSNAALLMFPKRSPMQHSMDQQSMMQYQAHLSAQHQQFLLQQQNHQQQQLSGYNPLFLMTVQQQQQQQHQLQQNATDRLLALATVNTVAPIPIQDTVAQAQSLPSLTIMSPQVEELVNSTPSVLVSTIGPSKANGSTLTMSPALGVHPMLPMSPPSQVSFAENGSAVIASSSLPATIPNESAAINAIQLALS